MSTRKELTLVETFGIMTVLSLFALIVLATTAPLREKAKEAQCMNHLSRIYQAIEMYRQDYQGKETDEASTPSSLGLPEDPQLLVPTYLQDPALLRCPSEYFGGGNHQFATSYMWQIRSDRREPQRTRGRRFSDMVRARKEKAPIVVDFHHGTLWHARPHKPYRITVLRLNGTIQRRFVNTSDSSKW